MEYLEENLDDWLGEELESFGEDDYLIFDCPGQIELYSNSNVFRAFTLYLQTNGWNVRLPKEADKQTVHITLHSLLQSSPNHKCKCHAVCPNTDFMLCAGLRGVLFGQPVRDRGEQVHCWQPAGELKLDVLANMQCAMCWLFWLWFPDSHLDSFAILLYQTRKSFRHRRYQRWCNWRCRTSACSPRWT